MNFVFQQDNRKESTNLNFLKEFTFHPGKNKHWAILGPAGSGKTTLLKTLIKQNSLTTSYVDVKHDFKNINSNSRFFYQQRYSNLLSADSETVKKYLEEIYREIESAAPYWSIEKVCDLFSLASLLEKHLIQLSNGETKRLRIAAALLKNPNLLLLDNPLIGLDVETRKKTDLIFKEIAMSGINLVITTLAEEIPEVITHVLQLDGNGGAKIIAKTEFFKLEQKLINEPEHIIDKKSLEHFFFKKENTSFQYLVRMKNIDIHYGEVSIVKDINWDIKPGERWVLSGQNGSGKSSLLSMIYGDHPQAYSKNLELFDRKRGSGETIWEIKEKIGFMSPELFQYFPGNYSCLQVVESGFYDTIGIFKRESAKDKKTAEALMEIMGIKGIQHKLLADVSTTQQRLTLLARALIKNPYLLILDEPCQGFDKVQQIHFRKIIDTVAQLSNMAIIYGTHHEEQLPECIDKKFKLS